MQCLLDSELVTSSHPLASLFPVELHDLPLALANIITRRAAAPWLSFVLTDRFRNAEVVRDMLMVHRKYFN